MKKKGKNQQQVSQNTVTKFKKVPYIGAGLALGISLAGLIVAFRLSDITLSSGGDASLTLPTPLPPSSQQPPLTTTPSLPEVTPTNVPEKLEPEEIASVATEPQNPEIVLPLAGEIIMPFSAEDLVYSKSLGDWRIHNGIDIRADNGTAVKAAASGLIERAFYDPQMGYTIVINHDDVNKTIYQNLASVEMVKEGESIEQGQAIAAVGTSAPAELLEDAHLHFSVLSGETYINPLDLLKED